MAATSAPSPAPATAASNRWENSTWLAKPVSGSWTA